MVLGISTFFGQPAAVEYAVMVPPDIVKHESGGTAACASLLYAVTPMATATIARLTPTATITPRKRWFNPLTVTLMVVTLLWWNGMNIYIFIEYMLLV
jgi:hypothetical protein